MNRCKSCRWYEQSSAYLEHGQCNMIQEGGSLLVDHVTIGVTVADDHGLDVVLRVRETFGCVLHEGKPISDADHVSMYLDYVNNFMTVAAFADHYGIDDATALEVIEDGRELHEEKTK